MNSKPKISIVTITYNAEKFIESTIISILQQTYKNIEYIIIDGKSTDKTNNIIQNHKNNIDIYVSEKDDGIYDAMNKGLSFATGDFIWFINAGDEIYEKNTLEKIFNSYENEDAFYGRTQLFYEDGTNSIITPIPKNLTWKDFIKGMVVSHQSIIFKLGIVEPYDLKYTVISDQDWIISALKRSNKIKNTELILSRYLLGGFSDSNINVIKKERFRIAYKHYGIYGIVLNHFYFFINDIKRIIMPNKKKEI